MASQQCMSAIRIAAAVVIAAVSPGYAQEQPDLAAKLQSLGRVTEPRATAALYAPSLATQSYAGVRVTRDLGYGSDNGQRLDLFAPEPMPAAPLPVLVFIHGGGFVAGDKHAAGSPFYDNVMLWAVRHGMVGVNVNPRLAPLHQWPSGAEDIGLAVQWVRKGIAANGGDPRRIFILGHSSGAALAASYIAQPSLHGPDGVGLAGAILMSGNIFDPATADASPSLTAYYGDDPSRYAERSAMPGLARTPVPLMVTLTEFDPLPFTKQILALRDTLCGREHCPTFNQFAGHNHFSQVYSINSSDESVDAAILAFIRATP